nr:gibberellin 2-beta-dioxygenase 1 [Ipomoea batatas]
MSNKTAAVPSVSLSEPAEVLSACKQLGFFQLSRHAVESELANSAESVALSLFDLPHDRKEMFFPKNWPLGFDSEADDDDHGAGESFCLDSACSAEETELDLSSLRAFTREMEKIGKEVTEALASIVGFDNPAREDPTRISSLLWISDGSSVSTPVLTGRMYPFVIGLQYQIRCQKYHMLTDSGWVSISPEVDSILVTVGDIAQVWSNGKLNKVRGRTVPAGEDGSRCISITLLITLPLDSIVSPMFPNPEKTTRKSRITTKRRIVKKKECSIPSSSRITPGESTMNAFSLRILFSDTVSEILIHSPRLMPRTLLFMFYHATGDNIVLMLSFFFFHFFIFFCLVLN